MTTPPTTEKLRSALSEGHWEQATALLQQLDLSGAAELLMDLPFE